MKRGGGGCCFEGSYAYFFFVFLFFSFLWRTGSRYIAQAGLELLGSSYPPISASLRAGITGTSHSAGQLHVISYWDKPLPFGIRDRSCRLLGYSSIIRPNNNNKKAIEITSTLALLLSVTHRGKIFFFFKRCLSLSVAWTGV